METKHWKVKFGGRLLGAIGIVETFTEHVQGPNRDAALFTLYEKYDHVMCAEFMELKEIGVADLCTQWCYSSGGKLWGPRYTCPCCGVGKYKIYRGNGEYSHDPFRICSDCGALGCPGCIDEKWRRVLGKNVRIFKCKNEWCKDGK